jgi:hypothetical protein
MKNDVFWDVTQCGSRKYRRFGGSATDYFKTLSLDVRFEVFTAVNMKKGVFWDVTPCESCKYRRFGGSATDYLKTLN